jgi:hypothetical protein
MIPFRFLCGRIDLKTEVAQARMAKLLNFFAGDLVRNKAIQVPVRALIGGSVGVEPSSTARCMLHYK